MILISSKLHFVIFVISNHAPKRHFGAWRCHRALHSSKVEAGGKWGRWAFYYAIYRLWQKRPFKRDTKSGLLPWSVVTEAGLVLIVWTPQKSRARLDFESSRLLGSSFFWPNLSYINTGKTLSIPLTRSSIPLTRSSDCAVPPAVSFMLLATIDSGSSFATIDSGSSLGKNLMTGFCQSSWHPAVHVAQVGRALLPTLRCLQL